MDSGWVKIHRKMLDWRWAKSPKHFILFLNLLLRANHKKTEWRKEIIEPGQLLTGRKQLAEWTGLSQQSVRTVLNDLKSTNEITIKSTPKYSIITILKWDTYQCDNQVVNQQVTNSQPTSNQQVTTSKNEKNVKNENKLYTNDSTNRVKIDPMRLIDSWNKKAPSHLRYPALSFGGGTHMENFLLTVGYPEFQSLENWEKIFDQALKSDFLINGPLSLTWLLRHDNLLDIQSGKYSKGDDKNKIFGKTREELLAGMTPEEAELTGWLK